MLKAALSASLLAAVLWSASAAAQTTADTNARPDARMKLGGEFIGANDMVSALSRHCPGDYGDAPYDVQGALVKLRPYLSAEESFIFSDYANAGAYQQDQRIAQDKVRHAFNTINATTQNAIESCRILARDILAGYATTKAALERLR